MNNKLYDKIISFYCHLMQSDIDDINKLCEAMDEQLKILDNQSNIVDSFDEKSPL